MFRADLAQMALAREEIPASLGNANFLSWFWHYSNAVGGVTIHVRHCEAEQARRVLVAARAKITEILPPWICSSCGRRVAGQWDACWQCGRLADGTAGGTPDEDMAAQPAGGAEAVPWLNVSRLTAVAASVALMILLLTHGPIPPLVLAPFVFFFVFLLRQFELSPGWQSEPQGAAEPGRPWRRWTAFFFNIATILFCLAFVGMVLFAFLQTWQGEKGAANRVRPPCCGVLFDRPPIGYTITLSTGSHLADSKGEMPCYRGIPILLAQGAALAGGRWRCWSSSPSSSWSILYQLRGIWFQAYMSSANISLLSLIGMSFRRVDARMIVQGEDHGRAGGHRPGEARRA